MSSEERSKVLLDIADALEANEKQIISENEADVSAAQKAGYEKSLISRLALKPGKVLQCFTLDGFFLYIIATLLQSSRPCRYRFRASPIQFVYSQKWKSLWVVF